MANEIVSLQYKGQTIEVERLPNGKFRKPEIVKKLSGSYSGSQMKPAHEVILVAMRPLKEKTFVDQALKNGKGVTWLDDGRIPYVGQGEKYRDRPVGKCQSTYSQLRIGAGGQTSSDDRGRFPANLLCSDNALDDGRIIRSCGGTYRRNRNDSTASLNFGDYSKREKGVTPALGDSGSFSRYFDLDAWWAKGNVTERIKQLAKQPCAICGCIEKVGNWVDNDDLSYCDKCMMSKPTAQLPESMQQEYDQFMRGLPESQWYTERIKQLPESVQKTFPFLIVPKASKSEKNEGLDSYLTVKYNIPKTSGGTLCDEAMVAAQLLQRAISGLTVHWSKDGSGASITALCLKDSFSTTLTEISRTIESKILHSLMHSLTSESTQAVNGLKVSGGNHAEDVGELRECLLTITEGQMELARGASSVALQTLLTIREKDAWQEFKNSHATVKPLKLMQYLITIGSREGEVVLDPFLGSGTTALAAKMLNRKWIGIELDESYITIAANRLAALDNT